MVTFDILEILKKLKWMIFRSTLFLLILFISAVTHPSKRALDHSKVGYRLEYPLPRAIALWDFKPKRDKEEDSLALNENGPMKVEIRNIPESVDLHGNDRNNYVVTLEEGSFLSMEAERAKKLRPSGDEVTLYVNGWVGENDAGTLFFSDFLSLGIHPSGLAIAMLGVKTDQGTVYRELPLAMVERGKWMDLIVRVGKGNLDFFSNGVLMRSIPVKQKLSSPFDNEIIIGAYGWHKGMDQFFVRSCEKGIKKIGLVALWDSALSDSHVAYLSGVAKVETPDIGLTAEDPIRDYNAFFDASLSKDLERCDSLWKSMRNIADKDPWRPDYHLTQPLGWIFDPAGAYYFENRYHVFSYHNIYAQLSYNGLDHYVSEDLIHWTQWPVGPWADSKLDNFGIWLMNHFIDDEGVPSVIYTGIGSDSRERALAAGFSKMSWGGRGVLARSRDGLISYEDKKAVLNSYHHDGHTWKDGDLWYTITSKRYQGTRPGLLGDAVMLWSSSDLINWNERGEIFAQRKDTLSGNKTGGMEFPYLLSFNDKDVLILGGFPVRYWVGKFDHQKLTFIPENEKGLLLDYSNPFHCFNPLCVDRKGPGGSERRIIMAMLNSIGGGGADFLPWNGVHVLPRSLKIDGNHLRQDPLPEFRSLRGEHTSLQNIEVGSDSSGFISKRSDAFEIIAEFEPGNATRFGLKVRVSDDKSSFIRIYYDTAIDEFGVDGQVLHKGSGPSYIKEGNKIRIHLFLDKQLLEVFVNGQTCTTAAKDKNLKNTGLDLFSEGGTAFCSKLDLWLINPSEPQ